MAALAGKLAAVYVQTDDAAVAFTTEATTEDATHLRYSITDQSKRWFDPDTAITVYADAAEVDAADYTIEYAGGVIVFAVDPAATITVTGAHLQVEAGQGFFNWSVEPTINTTDITELGASAKSYMATLLEFSGSAERFWYDEAYTTLLIAGARIALQLYVDTSTGAEKWYDCYVRLTGAPITVAMDDAIKETINFQGDMGIYYRATA